MALVVPGILCAVGVLLIIFSAWLWLRSGRRRLCPGPRMRWFVRLNPLWIAYQPRCAYDLRGHALDQHGGVTCPECGRHVRNQRQMLRSARSFHPGRLGVALIVGGFLVHEYPPLAATTVVQYTPTNMLLRGEGMLGVGTPLEVREEIRRRAIDFQLDDSQIARFVRLLVNDLRDDHLVGNAKEALGRLGVFAVYDERPLLDALESDDAQQRRMAAEVLRELPRDGAVPEAVLRATIDDLRTDDRGWNALHARWYLHSHLEEAKPLLIEALRSDDPQQRREVMTLLRNIETTGETLDALLRMSVDDLRSGSGRGAAHAGFQFLLKHAEVAEPLLADGMRNEDARVRLLCAAIAGCGGRGDLMAMSTPILATHLADNEITGDAIVAARGLAGFGVEVVTLLEPYRRSADEQQRQSVEYIVRRLANDESPIRLQKELPLARLTNARRDALVVDPDDLRMPGF